MDLEKLKRSTTTDGRPPDPGFEDAPAPGPIDPRSGMHTHYWVLSEEERAKGWVRPLRRSYRHVGLPGPTHPLLDLTAEQQRRHNTRWEFSPGVWNEPAGYVKFESYEQPNPDGSSVTGMFWTQARLDQVGKGCGTTTTMGLALCETWARDVHYYGLTFCCGCGDHLPVAEFVWTEDGERLGT